MTKKDFELIARVMVASHDLANWACIARKFARELAATNPRFDSARFLAACGLPEG